MRGRETQTNGTARSAGGPRRASPGLATSGESRCEDPVPPPDAGPSPGDLRSASGIGRPRPWRVGAILLGALLASVPTGGTAAAGAPTALDARKVRYERLDWARLASAATRGAPEPTAEAVETGTWTDHLPPAVRALHGRHVLAEGFVVLLDIEPDGTRLLMLTPAAEDATRPGLPARPEEWVLVRVPPGDPVFVSDLPTTIRGRLFLNHQIRDGQPASFYRIEAESAVPRGVFGW